MKIFLSKLSLQRALHEPYIDASELGALNKLKGDSMIEVIYYLEMLTGYFFIGDWGSMPPP